MAGGNKPHVAACTAWPDGDAGWLAIIAQPCFPPRLQQAGSLESPSEANTAGAIGEKLKSATSSIASLRRIAVLYSNRRRPPRDMLRRCWHGTPGSYLLGAQVRLRAQSTIAECRWFPVVRAQSWAQRSSVTPGKLGELAYVRVRCVCRVWHTFSGMRGSPCAKAATVGALRKRRNAASGASAGSLWRKWDDRRREGSRGAVASASGL